MLYHANESLVCESSSLDISLAASSRRWQALLNCIFDRLQSVGTVEYQPARLLSSVSGI